MDLRERLRERLRDVINKDNEISLDTVTEKTESMEVINQISKINISKEILEKIDISSVGQEIAIMLDTADEMKDACEEISEMELMSKLWNAISGKTTDTLISSQSFQIEMSKMILRLSVLNTLFAKEINNQTQTLIEQQNIIDSQNRKIIKHQEEIEKQSKESKERQRKILELIQAQKRQDNDLEKLLNKINENDKVYKQDIYDIKQDMTKEYNNKYMVIQDKYNKLKRALITSVIVGIIFCLMLSGLFILKL